MSDPKHVVKIVVTDLVTGESEEVLVPAADYFILATEPCHVAHIQTYKSGQTVQLTIKDRILR